MLIGVYKYTQPKWDESSFDVNLSSMQFMRGRQTIRPTFDILDLVEEVDDDEWGDDDYGQEEEESSIRGSFKI